MKPKKKLFKTFTPMDYFKTAIYIICAVLLMICVVLGLCVTTACETGAIEIKEYIAQCLMIGCAAVLSFLGMAVTDRAKDMDECDEYEECESINGATVVDDDMRMCPGVNRFVEVEDVPIASEYDFEAFA